MQHDPYCPRNRADHDDAAKRAADQHNLHIAAGAHNAVGKWIAIALADGDSDGVLYDSKTDAIRHQHHNEMYYMFVCVGPASLSVCEMASFLHTNRMMHDAGIPLTDPREVIRRVTVEDDRSLMRSIASRGRLRPSNLIIPPN